MKALAAGVAVIVLLLTSCGQDQPSVPAAVGESGAAPAPTFTPAPVPAHPSLPGSGEGVPAAADSATDPADPAAPAAPAGSSTASPNVAPASPPPPAPSPTPLTTLAARVLTLRVGPEIDSGSYDRDLFADWFDADADGCNTRCEVLEAERRPGGDWYSAYDGTTTVDPSSFDIDHMVPLAEAWRSGASRWDPQQRAAYSNDLSHPLSLIAVSASTNRSKGDRDPAQWMPPATSSWCPYVDAWVSTKITWNLSADPAEVAALGSLAAAC